MADSSRQALESAISGTRHEYPRLEAAHSASKRWYSTRMPVVLYIHLLSGAHAP